MSRSYRSGGWLTTPRMIEALIAEGYLADSSAIDHHELDNPTDKDDLLRRLRRVEGQVRGLQQMIEDDRYCIDVLTQVSAATKALQTVALALLDDHLRHCVAEAVAGGGPEGEAKLEEATAAIQRLVKS